MNELKKKMTPRQRCAITFPIANTAMIPHVRHHRRNAPIDSILTFDVHPEEAFEGGEEEQARAVDGWVGIWHARVSMHPRRHLKTWPNKTINRAKHVMLGLMKNVGLDEGIEIHNGADLHSVHVYKWATHDEVRLAMSTCESFFTLHEQQQPEEETNAAEQ